jgi:hypothetical protein
MWWVESMPWAVICGHQGSQTSSGVAAQLLHVVPGGPEHHHRAADLAAGRGVVLIGLAVRAEAGAIVLDHRARAGFAIWPKKEPVTPL